MIEEVSFHIGKDQARLDETPYRAYFYWKRDGHIVLSADFSKSELESLIARLRNAGEATEPYEIALRLLT